MKSGYKLIFLIPFALIILCSGCKVMMYPVALWFGGPTETMLEEMRKDFAVLKENYQTADNVFMPAYLRMGPEKQWDASASAYLRMICAIEYGMRGRCDTAAPAVPFGQLGSNQYKFLWDQAEVYADYIDRTKPQGDYFWFTEIFIGDTTGAYAIQTYVITRTGRIAYARQLNSHQFKPSLLRTPEDCSRFLMKIFLEAMKRSPEEQYPPYGIG
jgi:hypothetical protein